MLEDSALKEYINLLFDLHVMMKSGKGDTEEANSIRDRMEFFYYDASELQVQVTNEISVLFYKLDGK